MTALSAARDTRERGGKTRSIPVAASTTIYKGSLVAINASGYAVPASTATGLKGLGRAKEAIVNSGSAGDVSIEVETGIFCFANDGTNAVTRAHIGSSAYAVDDQTVASTDGSGTRSAIGTVFDVDAYGVWVRFV